MISLSARKNLNKALKAALTISSRRADEIIDRNYCNIPYANCQGVVVVNNDNNPTALKVLRFNVNSGIYEEIAEMIASNDDLTELRLRNDSDTITVPEGVVQAEDVTDRFQGTIVSARANNPSGILVDVRNDASGEVTTMALLAELCGAEELLDYAMEQLNKPARMTYTRAGYGTRGKITAEGLPILEMVITD